MCVCGLSETWLQGINEPPENKFYRWVGKNRLGKRGGWVGFLVRNDIYRSCDEITDSLVGSFDFSMEFCGISCNFRGNLICLVSVYLPSGSDTEISDVRFNTKN